MFLEGLGEGDTTFLPGNSEPLARRFIEKGSQWNTVGSG
jgi:hypothetical protein